VVVIRWQFFGYQLIHDDAISRPAVIYHPCLVRNVNDITQPSIAVGTYGKYNRCRNRWAWLNPLDYDSRSDFYTACYELHDDEEDPELMFQEWEGFPNGNAVINESGWLDWEFIDSLRKAIENHNAAAYIAFVEWSFDTDYSKFEDAYYSEAESEEAFTEAYLVDNGALSDVPEWVIPAIDFGYLARDLFSSDFTLQDGFVFRNC